MAARGLLKALRGFHASPYKFDKVNVRENIGKGEGAQVYGNGFYIAEAEPTMQQYYDAFKSESGPLLLNGKPVDVFWNDAIEERWPELFEGRTTADRERLHVILGNLGLSPASEAPRIIKNFNAFDGSTFDRLVKPYLAEPPPSQAYRYELEMGTDDSRLLNWDKILGDQPDEVFDAVAPQVQKQREIMAAARKKTLDRGTDFRGRPLTDERLEQLTKPMRDLDEHTGEEVYKMMGWTDDAGKPAKDQKQGYQLAADRLQAAGIDGTKYLDQLSRPSIGNESFPVKNPTYNYAIWNDDIITILRRYGLPITGAGVATLASMLNQRQPEMA